MNPALRTVALTVVLTSAFVGHSPARDAASAAPHEIGGQDTVREFTIRCRRHEFSPARLEVGRGDIVRITLIAEDVPHSFTIDEYRISKRVAPGSTVTFEFCANQSGRFLFFCSLSDDEGCRDMRGELIVK